MKVFFIGMMGSGKTSTGKKLAKLMSYRFIDVDQYIEENEKKSITSLFEEIGEQNFRKLEQMYFKQMIAEKDVVISTGGGLPSFHNNMELINKSGTSIYLEGEPAFLKSRLINQKAKRPLIAQIPEEDLETFLASLLKKRQVFYQQAHIHISAKSVDVKTIMKEMERYNRQC